MVTLPRSVLGCITVGLLLLTGCNESEGGKSSEVSVTVLLNGKPLPEATIILSPESGPSGTATTNAEGVATVPAAPGLNRVMVNEAANDAEARGQDADQEAIRKLQTETKNRKNRPIPSKYNTLATSDLKLTIEPGKTDYTLELKR